MYLFLHAPNFPKVQNFRELRPARRPTAPILLLGLMLWASALAAQNPCLCCKKRDSGQAAFNKGDYKTAIARWTEGTKVSDAAQCTDLNGLIKKAKEEQAKKDRAAGERQRKTERERMEKEKQDASARAADDGYWDALKDGDAADCDKYLRKYPNGRHAEEAKRRKRNLSPASPNIPLDMKLIKGGSYTMGDLFGEGGSDEKQHNVTVSDFYMGINEVTFDEFDAFCDATNRSKPNDEGWGRGKRPVINVDWYDAVEYCNWLSQQRGLSAAYTIDKNTKDPNNSNSSDTKKWTVRSNRDATGYRLPTEAEWEYAAREGGKKRRFGNGKDLLDPNEANFDASSAYKKAYSVAGTYRQQTVPVDEISGAANALGLRHLAGNVWEWCLDWYDAGYYDKSPGENPKGPDAGQYRVFRGGSWYSYPELCRAAFRYRYSPSYRYSHVGFRVVRGY